MPEKLTSAASTLAAGSSSAPSRSNARTVSRRLGRSFARVQQRKCARPPPAWTKSGTAHPDVIVYECRGTWEIRLGDELQGVRFTLESALERARNVAAVLRRPAWRLDETGYPLRPIERDTLD